MSFPVILSFKGKTVALSGVTTSTKSKELHALAREALDLSTESVAELKLLYKGKRLPIDNDTDPVFPPSSVGKAPIKIFVVATPASVAKEIATKKSDPTIRGFEQEESLEQARIRAQRRKERPWGDGTSQDKNYKFCRFEPCTWQSFGHRPIDSTPHDYAAAELLRKLATDPGIVAVMKERELVVGTLGEMDPVDDRIMQKKQAKGACLLGYNTNGGLRIDVKLRTDDLKGFRSYRQLVATVLHELSHNWVGEHNLLFWTNYAQMRAEYLFTHSMLRSTLVDGRTTAEIAELDGTGLANVYEYIVNELVREMAQHGLHPNMIADPIRQRIEELEREAAITTTTKQRLGGGGEVEGARNGEQSVGSGTAVSSSSPSPSPRERALAAAEKRRQQQERTDKVDKSQSS